MSLAVLFPGQGSIAPGAGRPGSTTRPGRSSPRSRPSPTVRSPRCCSTPRAEPARHHRRRPARHPHPLAGGAGRRARPASTATAVAFAGHSLGPDHGAHRRRRRRPRPRASPSPSPGPTPAGPADDARPGRLAALLGATLEQAARGLRRGAGRLLGRQRQRPRPGGDRRDARGPRRRHRGRPRARRAQGDAARRRRRLPHPAAGRRRPTRCAGARPPPRSRHRRRRSSTTPRPPSAPTATTGPTCSPATSSSRCAGARCRACSPASSAPPSCVELAPAGTLTAMAKRTIPDVAIVIIGRLDEPRSRSQVLMSGEEPARPRAHRPRAGHRSVRGRRRRRGRSGPARRTSCWPARRSAAVVGSGRTRRSPRRSPACSPGCSPTTASGCARASPSPGCGWREHARSERLSPSPGSGSAAPERVVTNADLEADARHLRRVDPHPLGHRRAPLGRPATRPPRRWPPRPSTAALKAAGRTPDERRPARARHLHARPAAAATPPPPCATPSAAAAARSTSTAPAPASSTALIAGAGLVATAPGPVRRGRRRAHDLDRRPGRPGHRRALRRRRRRRSCSSPATAALLGWDAGTDGSLRSILEVPAGERYMHMDGGEVFRRAVRIVVDSADRRAGSGPASTAADVDLFVPHQANVRIIEAARTRLGIDPPSDRPQRRPLGQHLGRVDRHRPRRGRRRRAAAPRRPSCSLSGFGAGMTWATAVLRWA